MAFRNEVVSDDDIVRYNLPFPKGGGRWWTRDAERDYYLWGGITGNPAYESQEYGFFFLYIQKILYRIKLVLGKGSSSLSENPYRIRWEKIAMIDPEIPDKSQESLVTTALKEALQVYGYDGEDDDWLNEVVVSLGF